MSDTMSDSKNLSAKIIRVSYVVYCRSTVVVVCYDRDVNDATLVKLGYVRMGYVRMGYVRTGYVGIFGWLGGLGERGECLFPAGAESEVLGLDLDVVGSAGSKDGCDS